MFLHARYRPVTDNRNCTGNFNSHGYITITSLPPMLYTGEGEVIVKFSPRICIDLTDVHDRRGSLASAAPALVTSQVTRCAMYSPGGVPNVHQSFV